MKTSLKRIHEEIGRRLRESGVWVGSNVACNWNDKKTGGVEFWLDVCVAQGLMQKAPVP